MENKDDEGKLRYAILPIAGILAIPIIATILNRVFPQDTPPVPPTAYSEEAPVPEGAPPPEEISPPTEQRVSQERRGASTDSVYVPNQDNIGFRGRQVPPKPVNKNGQK